MYSRPASSATFWAIWDLAHPGAPQTMAGLAGLDQQREPPGEFDRAQGVIGGGGIGFGHGGDLRLCGTRSPDLEIALTRPTALRPPAAGLALSMVSGLCCEVGQRSTAHVRQPPNK